MSPRGTRLQPPQRRMKDGHQVFGSGSGHGLQIGQHGPEQHIEVWWPPTHGKRCYGISRPPQFFAEWYQAGQPFNLFLQEQSFLYLHRRQERVVRQAKKLRLLHAVASQET